MRCAVSAVTHLMDKTEPVSGSQKLTYHLDLPAQFTSWIQFYDELTRLALIQPATPTVRIKVFRAPDTIKTGESISVYLLYERQYIERMCLDEFRKARSRQPGYLFTVQEIEHLIRIVSNQAIQLTDWDILLKLNELLSLVQQQEVNRSSTRMESWQ